MPKLDYIKVEEKIWKKRVSVNILLLLRSKRRNKQ